MKANNKSSLSEQDQQILDWIEKSGIETEEVDREKYDVDSAYRKYIDSKREFWVIDADLPGSGWWILDSEY